MGDMMSAAADAIAAERAIRRLRANITLNENELEVLNAAESRLQARIERLKAEREAIDIARKALQRDTAQTKKELKAFNKKR